MKLRIFPFFFEIERQRARQWEKGRDESNLWEKESEAVRERERGEWSTREKESRVRERRVRKSSFSLHKVPFLVISPKFNISKMVKKSHFQKVGQNLGHSFNETFLNQLIYLYIIFNLVTFVGYILCLVDFCSHVSYTHRNLNALIFLR